MQLPVQFIENIQNAFGEKGKIFLAELPSRLDEAAQRWNLTLGEPFLLSYNYVCAAKQGNLDVVLKVGVPNRELTSEMTALRLWGASGAVRMLDSDPERGFILEERLKPGKMLATLPDDDSATVIAADILTRLWVPAPSGLPLITLRSWFDELQGLRPFYNGTTGKFPKKLVETAEGLLPGLFAESGPEVVLHGDFHHYNILSTADGWKVIDPKGVIGPRGYEIAPFMFNPVFDMPADLKKVAARRLDIFAERLGLERSLLLAWTVAFSVLSAWWDVNPETGAGGDETLARGEMFLEML